MQHNFLFVVFGNLDLDQNFPKPIVLENFLVQINQLLDDIGIVGCCRGDDLPFQLSVATTLMIIHLITNLCQSHPSAGLI